MKKIPFWCIAMLCTSAVYAQQDKTAMKYAQVISPELAKQHLSIIASDAFEGRETGTHGADTAAHYIANEFKMLGLQRPVKGSYFLDIPLVKNTLNASITVNGKAAVNGVDFYGYQPHSDTFIDVSQVAFVGYGTDSEIANVAMKGKIVVWINEDKPEPGKTANTGFRTTAAREQIIKNLQSKNPSLILAVNPGVAEFLKKNGARVTAGRMSIKKTDMGPLDMEAGIFWITTQFADQFVKASGKTYDELKAASVSGNAAQMIKVDVNVKYLMQPEDVKAVDVLGLLPGSDPKLKDEVLVISAHYDHLGVLPEGTKGDRVFNGADDDGSGTTGILEIATAFAKAKKEGHGPRRSILFLGNVGEEKGLLGSEYYTEHPVIPLQNTIVDLNIDMIGRVGADYAGKTDSANYVYVIGSSMLSTDLHKINENANSTYTKLELDYKYDDPNDPNRFYYRSDHYNFAKHNVPIIFYFNGVHADYHGLGDEVSKINFPLLAKRAQLVFYTAWDLANADTKPVVDGKK